jgi:hypothetical protein
MYVEVNVMHDQDSPLVGKINIVFRENFLHKRAVCMYFEQKTPTFRGKMFQILALFKRSKTSQGIYHFLTNHLIFLLILPSLSTDPQQLPKWQFLVYFKLYNLKIVPTV